ncbi:MAG: hypothetical protein ACTHK0_03405 [Ginsengibacter sp.]
MMKRIFTVFFFLFLGLGLFAQTSFAQNYSSQKTASHFKSHSKNEINFNGQWKGGFDEGGFGIPGFDSDIKYVLELTTNGSQVSGYSYTYFQEGIKRYYTICRLTGTINRETNDIEVTEIERTKFNTPPDFENCFQTHRLHYEKDSGNIEVLRGTWVPAPNQGRGCGTGTTVLSRRIVSSMPVGFMPHKNNSPEKNSVAKAPEKKPVHKSQIAAAPKKTEPPVHKKTEPVITKAPQPKIKMEETETVKSSVPKNENSSIADSQIKTHHSLTPTVKGFEKRRTDVVKTIDLEQPTFHLDFYDNGEIDGDSITVFYNGKVVLSHQRLSDKPVSLTLTLDKNASENIVTMYADNLGTIPPNTALMIVTDGGKRYEVRMESDYGKSGSVIFKAKE